MMTISSLRFAGILLLCFGANTAKAELLLGTPENLGITINSSSADAQASISADELALYFHSKRPGGAGNFDLYVATRASTTDVFGSPTNLDSINTEFMDRAPNISVGGLFLFFDSNRPDGVGGSDLWMASRASPSDPFSNAVNPGGINTPFEDLAPSLSVDGLTLFFGSNRPGGQGEFDLWMTARSTQSDPFGTPVNLGSDVNTTEDDTAPSISADGLTLLYGSKRPGGNGERDLWQVTRPTVDAPFGNPVNLSINTPFIENAPDVSLDGSTLYFASSRPGGFGELDLW